MLVRGNIGMSQQYDINFLNPMCKIVINYY